MDAERYLISRTIQDSDLTAPVDAGISARFFLDPTNRRVWETLVRHRADYGEVPTIGVMRTDYPNYKFVEVEEPMALLIDRVRHRHGLAIIQGGLTEALEAHDAEDLAAAQAALSHALNELATDIPNSRDTNVTTTGPDRIERYLSYKALDGRLSGIPTGFIAIDEATQGWQKGQLVTWVGLPKAGKSITLLHSAICAHASGFRPLFVGFEMSNFEQEERHDAFRAGLNPTKLRTGRLTSAEWKKLRRTVNQVEALPDFYFSADSASTTTITGILGKIETYEPDIVFLDGVYFMQDEEGEPNGSPQALTNITRGLKRLAISVDLPIVVSTQALEWKARGQKLTTGSIGYSSSFMQDSDIVLGIERTKDKLIANVRILGSRNCPPMDLYVRRDWNRGLVEELDDNPFEATEDEYSQASGF
jgi:hypothetical protein